MRRTQFKGEPIGVWFLPIRRILCHLIYINDWILGSYVGCSGCQGSGKLVLITLSMDTRKTLKTSWQIDIVFKFIMLGTSNSLLVVALSCPIYSLLQLLLSQATIDTCCTLSVVWWSCIMKGVLSSCPLQWSIIASCINEDARSAGLIECSLSSNPYSYYFFHSFQSPRRW